MLKIFAVICCGLYLFGCMHTVRISDRPSPEEIAKANSHLREGHGIAFEQTRNNYVFHNGYEFGGHNFSVGADSTYWERGNQNEMFSMSNRELSGILTPDRKLGFHEGARNGAITGAFVGFIAGLFLDAIACPTYVSSGSPDVPWADPHPVHEKSFCDLSPDEQLFYIMSRSILLGTVGGMAGGMLFGTLIGSQVGITFYHPR